VVVVLTAAVLVSGVLLLLTSGHRTLWLRVHQATFTAWFVVMTIHVLGHLVEMVRVAPRDWRRHRRGDVRGALLRRGAIVVSVAAGVGLGMLLRPSVTHWLTTAR
jgi:hypothetical protein